MSLLNSRASSSDSFRLGGVYTGRILKGDQPADLSSTQGDRRSKRRRQVPSTPAFGEDRQRCYGQRSAGLDATSRTMLEALHRQHQADIRLTLAPFGSLYFHRLVASRSLDLKVRDSVYASGRGNNWVKKTCAQRETLTIAGFALDEGKWDGIYLGRRKGEELVYAGKVDHALTRSPPPTCRSG
ncbi:hypothetical protein [Bradyrhizobium sp. SSUT77]|uniref:hypothetical protein n=1 Tax=Bradyrhizobium sp. SSUT77 TaxID=3040603 RepID=UPI0032666310